MKTRFASRLAAVAAIVATAATSAMAALPTGVSAGLDAIKADGLSLVDLIWPVVIAFVSAAIVLKLFKSFSSKL